MERKRLQMLESEDQKEVRSRQEYGNYYKYNDEL